MTNETARTVQFLCITALHELVTTRFCSNYSVLCHNAAELEDNEADLSILREFAKG